MGAALQVIQGGDGLPEAPDLRGLADGALIARLMAFAREMRARAVEARAEAEQMQADVDRMRAEFLSFARRQRQLQLTAERAAKVAEEYERRGQLAIEGCFR